MTEVDMNILSIIPDKDFPYHIVLMLLSRETTECVKEKNRELVREV